MSTENEEVVKVTEEEAGAIAQADQASDEGDTGTDEGNEEEE